MMKITLSTKNGAEIVLTMEEARELYAQLSAMFAAQPILPTPAYSPFLPVVPPIGPAPTWWPQVTCGAYAQ